MADFDLAIIGGGINGAGIARDAAGRGLKVVLIEQNDLASGTSSASSKLIHGGLRYLEHGAFRLVRAALSEREVLLRMAPHLIRPLRFVLPLDAARPLAARAAARPVAFYDLIGRREILPGTRKLDLVTDAGRAAAQAPLSSRLRIFRLLCRRRAPRRAQRARCRRTRRVDPHPYALRARRARRRLAADPQRPRRARRGDGAGAGQCGRRLGGDGRRDAVLRQPPPRRLRLDKGSHIVVRAALRSRPRLYPAGGRRPRRVRHSVPARLHPDRHHGSRLSPAIPLRSRRARTRSTICAA